MSSIIMISFVSRFQSTIVLGKKLNLKLSHVVDIWMGLHAPEDRDLGTGQPFTVSLSGSMLRTKYLGAIFDRNIDWEEHISNVRTKVSRANEFLKCRFYLETH